METLETTMTQEDIQKLMEARHGTPFEVLGPHYLEQETVLVIRAFLPRAQDVTVAPKNVMHGQRQMRRIHPEGLFEAMFPQAMLPFAYHLQLTQSDGHTHLMDDPYAFEPMLLTDYDEHLFTAGNHLQIFTKLGAHRRIKDSVSGVCFNVWAPNAERVSVVGNFNRWDGRCHPMHRHAASGVWELFIPGLGEGELYKYEIRASNGQVFLKTDPYAVCTEPHPNAASIVHDLEKCHTWHDEAWMTKATTPWQAPLSIYPVAMDRSADATSTTTPPYSYEELISVVLPSAKSKKSTHIALVLSRDAYAAQVSLYAPDPRYGKPEALMAFVDACHQNGIGVLLTGPYSHLPETGSKLLGFDGTCLYKKHNPTTTENNLLFAGDKAEVRNFLAAAGVFWREHYHIDGLQLELDMAKLYAAYLDTAPDSPLKLFVSSAAPEPTVGHEETQTLIQGRHDDPHALLGPHGLEPQQTTAIRAFLPYAAHAYVLGADFPNILYAMHPVHDPGFFEAQTISSLQAASYKLHGFDTAGNAFGFYDPYAFRACKNYRVGVPFPVFYRERFNSDASQYGGSGKVLTQGGAAAQEISWHDRPFSLTLTLPPLSGIVLKPLPVETKPEVIV